MLGYDQIWGSYDEDDILVFLIITYVDTNVSEENTVFI